MAENKELLPYEKDLNNAWDQFEKNDLKKAEKLTDSILKDYPDDIKIVALKAHILYKKNNFKESLEKFEYCLELDKIEKKNYGLIYY